MTTKDKKEITIALEKDIKTEHYPIVVAEGLDVVLKPDGYKRLPKTQTGKDEFDWENKKAERLILKYYTQVNSIAISRLFNFGPSQEQSESIKKQIVDLYKKLNETIGLISQRLGSPYISTTRELKVEIKGKNISHTAKLLLPIFREIYTKTEGIHLPSIDTLEQTNLLTQILFSFPE